MSAGRPPKRMVNKLSGVRRNNPGELTRPGRSGVSCQNKTKSKSKYLSPILTSLKLHNGANKMLNDCEIDFGSFGGRLIPLKWDRWS